MVIPDIEAIRSRLSRATEGPWYANINDLIGGLCVGTAQSPASQGLSASSVADMLRPADAEFIAHSRTDVEQLLAEVDALLPVYEAAKDRAIRPAPADAGCPVCAMGWPVSGGPMNHAPTCPWSALRSALAKAEEAMK